MPTPLSQKIATSDDMGQLILDRRRAIRMSQEVLASLSGIAQPNLSKIERGQGSAQLDTYLRLLSVIGVDLFGQARS